jgi:predicted N-formylglutamate amidohydrolase
MARCAMHWPMAMDFLRPIELILSCEHGGNRVPAPYRPLFARAGRVLASHAGHDIGAADFARRLEKLSGSPAQIATTTRLLVDLNRSVHHRALFSRYTRQLPDEDKACILDRYYHPWRNDLIRRLDAAIAAGHQVLHLSVHSFTPVLNGVRRNADLAFLYDPSRLHERAFAAAWRSALLDACPTLKVRRNYPYRGIEDGFVTALRRRCDARHYMGIELEVNQRLVARAGWSTLQTQVADTLAGLIRP